MAKSSNELDRYQKWAKKRQKGLSPFSYLNPDGGNVPLGIEFFNSAVSQSGPGDAGATGDSGVGGDGGMGESVDFERAEQDLKLYDAQQKGRDASNISKAQSQVLRAKALMDSKQDSKRGKRPIMEQQDKITLDYSDIDVTGYYGPTDWDTGIPTKEYDETISYEYKVDKDDVIVALRDKAFESNPDLDDDNVDSFIEEHFDEMFDEYYDYILEYFRDEATAEANENYDYEEIHRYDFDEDYDTDDDIDYLQEAGKHIEDIAKYKMDALSNEIDDLNQSLDDIVDSDRPDYRRRDLLANRLNSAQEDLIRLQDEFGYIIDKPVREFLENNEMSLREALNQFDYITDNAYDLRNTYDSLEESVELNKRLTKAIMRGANAKTLHEVLQGKTIGCNKQLKEAFNSGAKVYEKEIDGPPDVGRQFVAYSKRHKDYEIFVRAPKDQFERKPDAKDHISSDGEFYSGLNKWIYPIDFNRYVYVDELELKDSMNEDTIKRNGKWVNVGKDGKADSGKFKTKKEADAQRKAMYTNGYKGEALNEAEGASIYDKLYKYLLGQGVDLKDYE